ncbi:metallopeptidase TldD-related protein, partial [Candidatus Latescibacterota bacterium]
LSRDITIKALPVLKRYMDINLLGSYQVDAEGVKPPAEITLVENGILNTLLNNRIPTPKVRASNAHERPVLSAYRTSQTLGPSVISIESSEGKTKEALKRELLKRASEEGMDYGILVRRLHPMFVGSGPLSWMGLSSGKRGSSSLTRPLLIYRVYVADGREEPVRSAQLGDVGLSTLRHIAAVTKGRFVYNTLATANWRTGIPASFIVPESLILEEIEVKNEKRGYTPKLPVVPSPLATK